MQTSLVHARRPVALICEMGPRRSAAFLLLIAAIPATFLCVLPFYAVAAVTLFPYAEAVSALFSAGAVVMLVQLLLNNTIMGYFRMAGHSECGTFHFISWPLLNSLLDAASVATYKESSDSSLGFTAGDDRLKNLAAEIAQ